MSRRKQAPEVSTITRPRPVAYARKQKSGTSDEDDDAKPDGKPEDAKGVDGKAEDAKGVDARGVDAKGVDARGVDAKGEDAKAAPKEAAPVQAAREAPKDTGEQISRARVDTVGMPAELVVGRPPEMPAPAAPAPVASASTAVETPTCMPGPRDVPPGDPGDPAAPPGLVPPGDSRSLRRPGEFALIYRLTNAVICRFGALGTRGQWRVVEYPTTASASHAYAKECSRFVSEGFSDYRE